MPELTVLILTPLALEYAAVSKHLADRHTIVREGAAYEVGHFAGQHHTYKVVLRETGMKNADMALATERAIQHFDPQIAILCGIAGGIKDVRIGDVAIAKSAFNYDSGKESDDGFLPRPVEYHFSEDLLAYAQMTQRSEAWKKRTSDGAFNASIHIASVAAGDKVVAAVENATYQRITQFLSHCKFLEMEAAGFGLAVQRHRNIHALVVRGISDMCRGKGETDKAEADWQGRAADRAAGVVFELLSLVEHLNFIQLKNMEIKDIVKESYALLFPAALKEIGKDFADAVNADICALWQRVKPIFIEEVKELANAPDDADAQAAVRNKLKRGLEADAELKTTIEGLLEKAKASSPTIASVSVVNSKNVIAGSSISVGGDFRLGDINNSIAGNNNIGIQGSENNTININH